VYTQGSPPEFEIPTQCNLIGCGMIAPLLCCHQQHPSTTFVSLCFHFSQEIFGACVRDVLFSACVRDVLFGACVGDVYLVHVSEMFYLLHVSEMFYLVHVSEMFYFKFLPF
jgi:hypothetical protein